MHAAGFQGRAGSLRVLGAHEDKETGAKIDIMEKHAGEFKSCALSVCLLG